MSDDDWRRCIGFYLGFVSMLDRALGEIFEALKESWRRDDKHGRPARRA
jgi:arylsulfatase A-like enzyme